MLSILMLLVLALALCAPFVPFVLLALCPPFPGDLALACLYALIVVEKIYAMIFRQPTKDLANVTGDWTSVAVGLSYAAVMYAAIVEVFLRGSGMTVPAATGAGALVYAAAVALRYCAFHHLGRGWAVHLDRSDVRSRPLVRTGPYRWIRHPLYLGACLECVAVPLLLNAWGAGALALLVFCPLEVQRARYEERCLRDALDGAYTAYARDVPGFIPRLRRTPTRTRGD